MNTERPTPETDFASEDLTRSEMNNFARKLERERDGARERVKELEDEIDWQKREAIHDALNAQEIRNE